MSFETRRLAGIFEKKRLEIAVDARVFGFVAHWCPTLFADSALGDKPTRIS
jgi:hypothetical protein